VAEEKNFRETTDAREITDSLVAAVIAPSFARLRDLDGVVKRVRESLRSRMKFFRNGLAEVRTRPSIPRRVSACLKFIRQH
jgi:predicted transcriptional regulator